MCIYIYIHMYIYINTYAQICCRWSHAFASYATLSQLNGAELLRMVTLHLSSNIRRMEWNRRVDLNRRLNGVGELE